MRLLRGLAKGIFVLFIFSVIMGNLIDFQLKKGKENSSEDDVVLSTEVEELDTPGLIASNMSVTYVDVGQGNCSIINDDGYVTIVDTGYWDAYESVALALSELGIDEVDTLVLTHPDADHIGCADQLIADYDVDRVYLSKFSSDTKTYSYLMDAISEYNVELIYPNAGDYINYGNVKYEFVGPVETYNDANASSLVLKVTNEDNSFLFTGDMTGESFHAIIDAGYDLSADVVLLAHHGSANDGCNSLDFFIEADMDYAVCSSGLNNSYGHPHYETMEIIKLLDINLYRTDLQGTITCYSDGKSIKWSCAPSTNYTNGNNSL